MITFKTVKTKGRHYFIATLGDGTLITLHSDTVFKYGLLLEKTMSEKTYEAMRDDDDRNTLMQKSLDALAKKAMSRKSLATKLATTAKGSMLEETLDELERLGYIDDKAALKRIVEEMVACELKGPSFLEQKLAKDGFDSFDIKDALTIYTDLIQEEKIEALCEKELKALTRYPVSKQKQKLLTTLYQKGFDPHLSDSIVRRLIDENKASTDEDHLLETRISALKNRYDLKDHKEKQKLTQKLLREGFDYQAIKKKLL